MASVWHQAAGPWCHGRSRGTAHRPRWRHARRRDRLQVAPRPKAAAQSGHARFDRGRSSGVARADGVLPRSQPCRPCVRDTIRSASNSTPHRPPLAPRALPRHYLCSRASRGPCERTHAGPLACAAARAAHHHAPPRRAHPRRRRSPSPPQGSPARSPQNHGSENGSRCPQPRPVDRDHPRPHQPRLITQPQHVAEQLRQRRLMLGHEPRDRRVIRALQRRDHPKRHILLARPLDLPRRPHPARVRIQQQRHWLRGDDGLRGSRPASVLPEQLGIAAEKILVDRDFRASEALEAGVQRWAQAGFLGHFAAKAACTTSRVGVANLRILGAGRRSDWRPS